jgi:hypothetical protein
MNKTIVLGIFAVAVIAVVVGVAEFSVLQKQAAPIAVTPQPPQPVVTPTSSQPAPVQPLPQPPSSNCNVSQGESTSTWKTFKNANWEITFQYPPTFQLTTQSDWSVTISGRDGYNVYLSKDNDRGALIEGGKYPPPCPRIIASQSVGVIIDPYASVSSTRPDLAVTTHVFGLSSKTHNYTFIVEGPSSSSRRTTDTFINTIEFVK